MSEQIYRPAGIIGYASDLEAEFRGQPLPIKLKWWRGILSRELVIWLTGQKSLQKKQVSLKPRPKILWYYDGLSMGDCIMDLSQRQLLAQRADLDICITRAPIGLFEGDPGYKNIYRRPEDCPGPYDLILLQNISSSALRVKRRYFRHIPFATMLDHQQGEMYDRVTYSWLRLSQLFQLSTMEAGTTPLKPWLPQEAQHVVQGTICIPLGGADERRRYARWPEVLEEILQYWPSEQPKPCFVLVGSGADAQAALTAFDDGFLSAHCQCAFDVSNISVLRNMVAGCEFFLGVDGGVMHIAEALGKPGLAIFSLIKPAWRLQPQTLLKTLFTPCDVNTLTPTEIAKAFLASTRQA